MRINVSNRAPGVATQGDAYAPRAYVALKAPLCKRFDISPDTRCFRDRPGEIYHT